MISCRCQDDAAVVSAEAGGIVEGMLNSTLLEMERMVPRSILPDLVFGSLATCEASLKQAMGPIDSRTIFTSSASISAEPLR